MYNLLENMGIKAPKGMEELPVPLKTLLRDNPEDDYGNVMFKYLQDVSHFRDILQGDLVFNKHTLGVYHVKKLGEFPSLEIIYHPDKEQIGITTAPTLKSVKLHSVPILAHKAVGLYQLLFNDVNRTRLHMKEPTAKFHDLDELVETFCDKFTNDMYKNWDDTTKEFIMNTLPADVDEHILRVVVRYTRHGVDLKPYLVVGSKFINPASHGDAYFIGTTEYLYLGKLSEFGAKVTGHVTVIHVDKYIDIIKAEMEKDNKMDIPERLEIGQRWEVTRSGKYVNIDVIVGDVIQIINHKEWRLNNKDVYQRWDIHKGRGFERGYADLVNIAKLVKVTKKPTEDSVETKIAKTGTSMVATGPIGLPLSETKAKATPLVKGVTLTQRRNTKRNN